jgi:hypothetical protein
MRTNIAFHKALASGGPTNYGDGFKLREIEANFNWFCGCMVNRMKLSPHRSVRKTGALMKHSRIRSITRRSP